jgi:hypothetical protein
MGVWYITNKRHHINTVEKHYIYTKPKVDIKNHDRNTVTENAIFKVLLQHDAVQMVLHFPRKTIRLSPYMTFSTFVKVTECQVATSLSMK